jgi:hypothetical protein
LVPNFYRNRQTNLLAALERRLSEIEKTATDFGEIDQAAADPIHDHRPQSAPGHRVNRVLGILDQLDKETLAGGSSTK